MDTSNILRQKAGFLGRGTRVAGMGMVLGSLLALLAAGGLLSLPPSPGWAQSAGAQAMADFLQGQVSGKPTESTVRINNQTYQLSKNVKVTDENDVSRQLKDLEPGLGIKFHVKNGRIDHIVILLAR